MNTVGMYKGNDRGVVMIEENTPGYVEVDILKTAQFLLNVLQTSYGPIHNSSTAANVHQALSVLAKEEEDKLLEKEAREKAERVLRDKYYANARDIYNMQNREKIEQGLVLSFSELDSNQQKPFITAAENLANIIYKR